MWFAGAPTSLASCSMTPPRMAALTLGVETRVDTMVGQITAELFHGNVYVNRNMIGAVVAPSHLEAADFPEPDRRLAARTIYRFCTRTGCDSQHRRRGRQCCAAYRKGIAEILAGVASGQPVNRRFPEHLRIGTPILPGKGAPAKQSLATDATIASAQRFTGD